MAKRKRSLTENKIERLIKEGRGQGIGEEYKPWILVQDVPSLGRATRLKGIKTNRQHEFLSDMERDYFYILEYSNNVVDIREQFPLLPLEETILIAKELGIKHPTDPKTNEPIVMTTDFLVTINKNGKYIDVARTIKPQDELMNKRTLDKFEIERRYWEKQEFDWGIVTENEIDKVLAQNILYMYPYNDLYELDSFIEIEKEDVDDLVITYLDRIIGETVDIRKVSKLFDQDFNLKSGTGLSIFYYVVIRKIIRINLLEELDLSKVKDIHIEEENLKKEMKII
ncbi:TnsA endonuclease N-terminal domain-containing protein [Tepidibacter sp. Z1-5]|uniref:TnsA endonuclease N-terminal domain-containing protein n=1 Tax=Tepidibacter sp. Z1-5 TaxID=3134138 RepID=UPI0030BE48F6